MMVTFEVAALILLVILGIATLAMLRELRADVAAVRRTLITADVEAEIPESAPLEIEP
jgi:hypothetical protein